MSQALEKLEELDANVENLIVGLTRMLSFVGQVEKAVKLPQLQKTLEDMKNLIEDASIFVVRYKSEKGSGRHLLASGETPTDS